MLNVAPQKERIPDHLRAMAEQDDKSAASGKTGEQSSIGVGCAPGEERDSAISICAVHSATVTAGPSSIVCIKRRHLWTTRVAIADFGDPFNSRAGCSGERRLCDAARRAMISRALRGKCPLSFYNQGKGATRKSPRGRTAIRAAPPCCPCLVPCAFPLLPPLRGRA